MKRTLIGTLAAIFVATALIAAQDPADQKADQSKSQPPVVQQEKDKAVTYTVVVVLCGLGLMIVMGLVVGAIAAAGMVTTGSLPVVR